jgi:hypothetical protein
MIIACERKFIISFAMIGRIEQTFVKRRAGPPSSAPGSDANFPAQTVQLGGSLNAHSHQLSFIKNPQGIIVEQPKVHGPAGATHTVAAIESTRKKHILRADENGGAFGVDIPIAFGINEFLTAHQNNRRMFGQPLQVIQRRASDVQVGGVLEKILQPFTNFISRLFHKCTHWQAVHEPTRPLQILDLNPIPEPSQNDSGSFAETGWDVDELRLASCVGVPASKPSLVVEWFMAASCAIEKSVEAWRVHNSPPSTSPVSRFPILNCMRSP